MNRRNLGNFFKVWENLAIEDCTEEKRKLAGGARIFVKRVSGPTVKVR